MKKKLITILLCAAMAVRAGCGSTQKADENNSAISSQAEDAADTEEIPDSETEKTESSQTNAAENTEASSQEEASEESEKPILNFGSFTSTDLDGNEITEAIFSEKDLTIVNVWATFCGPCINEMPELGEWAKTLPDNVQLIGFVTDVYGSEDSEQIELAKSLVEEAGADYTHIVLSKDCSNTVLTQVSAVPTTIFLDSQGNLQAVIVGAYVDEYKQYVADYLAEQK